MLNLAQELIFERYKQPLFAGSVENANLVADGVNPLCGDEVHMEARIGPEGNVEEMRHICRACAICTASADLLAEHFTGKSQDDITAYTTEQILELVGIPLSPMRVKCAVLPLESLKGAL